MAHSTKGAGNFLFPLTVVAAAVVVAIAVTFTIGGEEPPDEPTVIAEDDVDARPAGAGTMPEGEADETVEGVTDQVDEVDPAAPGEQTLPPADMATGQGADDRIEGETPADEEVAGSADGETVSDTATEGSRATAQVGDAPAQADAAATDGADAPAGGSSASSEDAGGPIEDVADESFPAGRDTQTELSPQEGQDVVTDTDEGGSAFVPTPSGPEGRDNETIAD